MTRIALVLLLAASTTGCLVRARPLVPVRVGAPHPHVHFNGCGHHVKAVVVVR